jgi:hypothetical protein
MEKLDNIIEKEDIEEQITKYMIQEDTQKVNELVSNHFNKLINDEGKWFKGIEFALSHNYDLEKLPKIIHNELIDTNSQLNFTEMYDFYQKKPNLFSKNDEEILLKKGANIEIKAFADGFLNTQLVKYINSNEKFKKVFAKEIKSEIKKVNLQKTYSKTLAEIFTCIELNDEDKKEVLDGFISKLFEEKNYQTMMKIALEYDVINDYVKKGAEKYVDKETSFLNSIIFRNFGWLTSPSDESNYKKDDSLRKLIIKYDVRKDKLPKINSRIFKYKLSQSLNDAIDFGREINMPTNDLEKEINDEVVRTRYWYCGFREIKEKVYLVQSGIKLTDKVYEIVKNNFESIAPRADEFENADDLKSMIEAYCNLEKELEKKKEFFVKMFQYMQFYSKDYIKKNNNEVIKEYLTENYTNSFIEDILFEGVQRRSFPKTALVFIKWVQEQYECSKNFGRRCFDYSMKMTDMETASEIANLYGLEEESTILNKLKNLK